MENKERGIKEVVDKIGKLDMRMQLRHMRMPLEVQVSTLSYFPDIMRMEDIPSFPYLEIAFSVTPVDIRSRLVQNETLLFMVDQSR